MVLPLSFIEKTDGNMVDTYGNNFMRVAVKVINNIFPQTKQELLACAWKSNMLEYTERKNVQYED